VVESYSIIFLSLHYLIKILILITIYKTIKFLKINAYVTNFTACLGEEAPYNGTTDDGLRYIVRNKRFSFTCPAGQQLHPSNPVVRCNDGNIIGTFPTCQSNTGKKYVKMFIKLTFEVILSNYYNCLFGLLLSLVEPTMWNPLYYH
jgi:hypothetical protein